MSKLLYLKDYNNYFNRIVKRDTTFTNYTQLLFNDRNFNPNDDVYTERVENWNVAWTPDYMVLYDDNDTLVSRWFVNEAKRTRNGQYRITLKRDLVADFYDKIINAPMILDRAMITNLENPLLFNNEGFSFNQIKQQEILLQDAAKMPWYVLYFKKGSNTLSNRSGSFNLSDIKYDLKISTPIANSGYAEGTKKYVDNMKVTVKYRTDANDWAWSYFSDMYNMNITKNGIEHVYDSKSSLVSVIWFNNNFDTCKTQLNSKFSGTFATLNSDVLTDTGNTANIDETTYNKLMNVGNNGIYVLDSDNKLYQVKVREGILPMSGNLANGTTKTYVEGLINTTTLDRSDHFGDNTVNYEYNLHTLTVTATQVNTGIVSWTLYPEIQDVEPKTTTADSEFDIIAIPYEDCKVWATIPHYTTAFASKMLVDSISKVMGDNLVDIQLLPYCPFQNILLGDHEINISPVSPVHSLPSENAQMITYTPSPNNTYTATIILYLSSSNFSFDISCPLTVPSILGQNNAMAAKVDNECSLYKIVSPNYNGSFEFSVAKNKGVDFFNVDITLIPYNPYIHINPNFKGLYGTDWNDSKGLICGGDFSLPKYTTAWANYELNNKNYQQIFDRQVRNLDVNQSVTKANAIASMIAGSVQGAGVGMAGGAMAGGPVGAAIGGTVGAVGSVATGIADLIMLDKQQSEERSFMIDNYRYQLGNIKAMPDTINKVTPITFNNKLFPFLEVYSATQVEKDLFVNYLTYRSMTIQAIGTIESYLQADKTFISGKLLRLEELGLASHEAFEIYKELEKGVYI